MHTVVFVLLFVFLQQDGIYVNERFLHTFASCIVSIVGLYVLLIGL